MKKVILFLSAIVLLVGCKLSNANQTREDNKELAVLLDKYYEERLQFFPIEATLSGDNRYNDKMYVDFTDSYSCLLYTSPSPRD